MRASPSILGTIVLAGCFSHPAAHAPQPQVRTHDVVAAGQPTPRTDSASHTHISVTTTTTTSVSRVEVARRAVDIFGDSLILTPPPTLDSSAAEPSWDMDVRPYETQERVAYYVNMFTGRAKDRIAERLERGTRYEPMIRAKMKAGGLPEDMYYLALVESGFDPHAYSRAAAVGLWQFMTSTARDMGMRVDWWVDERRDPVRSTAAAVRFIRGLRDQFGSLYLAAAAYNGGPGRVSRGLVRYADDLENTQGEDAFFVLAGKDYLRNETREYVPQLIAAALIAKEPTRYGMELHPRAAFAYDSVRVPGRTPLAAVAKAAHTSLHDITDLNSHLLRGMTPPGESFLVRIPTGSAASFDSLFSTLPAEDLVATRTVETKKGDTMERLAHAHDISISTLQGFNPSLERLKSGRLVPGQTVIMPTAAVAAAALSVPDPSIERYPNSTSRMKVHTVRAGETVRIIARRYDTTPERLMRINGLRKPMIFPGQTLLLTASSAGKKKSHASAGKGTSKSVAHSASKSSGKSSGKSSRTKKSDVAKRSGASSKAGARSKSKKKSSHSH